MIQKTFKNITILGYILVGIIVSNGSSAQNVFTVTKTNDPDPFAVYSWNDQNCSEELLGTLRWAIMKVNDVNNTGGRSTINFNIPGSGYHVISLNSDLPPINNPVAILGEPLWANGHNPSVIIDGAASANVNNGLNFHYNSSESIIKGVHIRGMSLNGIFLDNVNGFEIYDNVITETGNGICGFGSSNLKIYNNYIGCDYHDGDVNDNQGNTGYGILIDCDKYCEAVPLINSIIGNDINEDNAKSPNIITNNKSGGIYIKNLSSYRIAQNLIYNNGNNDNDADAINLENQGNNNKTKPLINSIVSIDNITGTALAGDKIEIFGSTGLGNANIYLTTVTADATGNWTANLTNKYLYYPYIAATATDASNNTSELSISEKLDCQDYYSQNYFGCELPSEICTGETILLNCAFIKSYLKYAEAVGLTQGTSSNARIMKNNIAVNPSYGVYFQNLKVNFGEVGGIYEDVSDAIPAHTYNNQGTYTITIKLSIVAYGEACEIISTYQISVINCFPPCKEELMQFCLPDIICGGEEFTADFDFSDIAYYLKYAESVGLNTGGSDPEDITDNYASLYYIPGIWDFGDGTQPSETRTHTYPNLGYDKTYTVKLTIGECVKTLNVSVTNCNKSCEDCIGSFSPETGKYIVSAWVKEDGATPSKTVYTNPEISVVLTNIYGATTTKGPFKADNNTIIIDGWQRIEEELEIPDEIVYVQIKLSSASGVSYFDDIRVYPIDATVKSYVYDPVNLRFVAELDERNYATFYEYDEEGKLVRVKKETERGIMTIKESRNNIQKK